METKTYRVIEESDDIGLKWHAEEKTTYAWVYVSNTHSRTSADDAKTKLYKQIKAVSEPKVVEQFTI